MLKGGFYTPSSNYREEEGDDSLGSEIDVLQAIFSHTLFQEHLAFFTWLGRHEPI
jgi:hypothetical protein